MVKSEQPDSLLAVTLTPPLSLYSPGEVEMPEAQNEVLLVDDKECMRSTLSLVLVELGYSVRTAADGFSALRAIRQAIPDILLTDLNMPGMSGFELMLVFRRRFPEIQVIAMSGAFSGSEARSGIPADAFYQKGSSILALIQTFRKLAGMKQRFAAPSRTGSPLWIQRNGTDPSGKAFVRVSCPECLRDFPQTLEGVRRLVYEVACVHCGSMIEYSMVEPGDRMPPQGSRRGSIVSIAARVASALSD